MMTYYLFLLLTFFLIGRPQDFFTSLASFRPALVLTLITLGMTFLGSGKDAVKTAFRAKESKMYALFYIMMILSIPLAVHRRFAFEFTILVYLSTIVYFFIFLVNVNTVIKLKTVMFIICCSVLFYSALGLITGKQVGVKRQHANVSAMTDVVSPNPGEMESSATDRLHFGIYDPNDLAFFLVSLFPLSIYFIIQHEGFIKKVLGLMAVGISTLIILMTGSRGGLLGLLCVAAIFIFKNSGSIKWSTKILLILIGISVIAGYGYKINTERYTSLANVSSDYNVTSEGGRLDIWGKGLLLIASNPVTGVGVNCFAMAIGELRADRGEAPKWQSPHNSYLQIAAEIGLVGLFFFYSMIAGSLRNISYVLKSNIEYPHARDLRAIAASMQMGFVSMLIVAFFLTQAYNITFTLYLAFSVILKNIAQEFQNSAVLRGNLPWGRS